MDGAFFLLDGENVFPTEWTRGPWDPGQQHAGPAAALLGRAVEHLESSRGFRVARLTMEILRGIPIKPLRISARIERGGKRVQLATATLSEIDGPDAARASVWLLRETPGSAPEVSPEAFEFPGATDSIELPVYDAGTQSYFTAMELRFARGSFFEPGPAAAWMRMRIPLVDGEQPSPLTRALTAADSGNGISSVLDIRRHLFINVELTTHFVRMPKGEWMCVDAQTLIDRDGIGVAEARLWDVGGRFGGARQSLLIAPRT